MSQNSQIDGLDLKTNPKGSYHDQKDRKRKNNKLKTRIRNIEKEINEISEDLKNKDLQLSDPVKFKQLTEDKEFFEIYGQQQNKLKQLEEKWTNLVEELENIS
jgi:hypothetical protein